MGKNQLPGTQEVIFASSNRSASRRITSLLKEKMIRKIAPRIYTSNLSEEPSTIIKRNWYRILASQYPDALLSHRSALEFKPTPGGHIFLTYTYTENIRLPGMTIHFLKGPGRIEGDNLFFENLYASQEARAYLENLQETRKKGETSKCLALPELEEKFEAIIRVRGEQGLNTLRDKAREIAPVMGMLKEFKKLNRLISDLLATGKVKNLTSPAAKARALGEPFDPDRIKLFEILYNDLAGKIFPSFEDRNTSNNAYNTFAFFESYFSNYIEGTEFTVSEAKDIITSQTPMPARDEDSHDILGTYRIADPFITMLVKIYQFSAALHDESINSMEQHLMECDAFKEPTEGKLKILPPK